MSLRNINDQIWLEMQDALFWELRNGFQAIVDAATLMQERLSAEHKALGLVEVVDRRAA